MNRVSLGALVEFGTSSSLNSKDASFEIIASYFLGNPQNRRQKVVKVFDTLDDDIVLSEEEEKITEMEEELDNAEKAASEEKIEEAKIAEAAAVQKKKDEEAIAAILLPLL